jgi:hypothetical protein
MTTKHSPQKRLYQKKSPKS